MFIKICCIQDGAELFAAADAGATHVGLVGAMPSGPGPISDDEIRRVADAAPDELTTVLLTSRADAGAIIDHVVSTEVKAVQIVSHVSAYVRRRVRDALPSTQVLQAVHVEGPESVEIAMAAAEGADFILLDSGRPSAVTPELGGTGRTHDWSVSERIVAEVSVPVVLAGGLNAENVRDAIRSVRPAGVDVCSGLRDQVGRLDPDALASFVGAVRSA